MGLCSTFMSLPLKSKVFSALGTVLFACSVTLFIFGGLFPSILEDTLRTEILALVLPFECPCDIDAAMASAQADPTLPNVKTGVVEEAFVGDLEVKYYNITNLAEMELDNTVKPAFSVVSYKLNKTTTQYETHFVDNVMYFKEYIRYEGIDAAETFRLENDIITSVNPVYVGVMSKYGAGSEVTFGINGCNGVLAQLAPAFYDELGALAQGLRLMMISTYLNNIVSTLLTDGTFFTDAEIANHWKGNSIAPVNAKSLSQYYTDTNSITDVRVKQFLNFEVTLSAAMPDTVADALLGALTPTANGVNLRDARNTANWIGLIAGTPAEQAGAQGVIGAALVGAGAAPADVAAHMGEVAAWIAGMALAPQLDPTYTSYLYNVANYLGTASATASVSAITTWSEMLAAQYAMGVMTVFTFGLPSVADVIPGQFPVVPEFYAYLSGLTPTQFALAPTDVASSVKLMTALKDPTIVCNGFPFAGCFGVMFVTHSLVGDLLGDWNNTLTTAGLKGATFDTLADMGLSSAAFDSPVNVHMFNYLSEHLVDNFLIKPELTAKNAGLFISRPAKDFLFGWESPLLTLLEVPATFNALFGTQYATIEEYIAANPTKEFTGERTGFNNKEEAGQLHSVNGLTHFSRMDEIMGTCPIDLSTGAEIHDCLVWNSVEVIQGSSRGLQVAPLHHEDAPKPHLDLYVGTIGRTVPFDYGQDLEYKGIKMRSYHLGAYPLLTSFITARDAGMDTDYATKYDNKVDGLIRLEYFLGAPAFAGGESMLLVPESERSKFSGVTAADWVDNLDQATYLARHDGGVYLYLEPITGAFMKGRSALLVGFDILAKNINLYHLNMLTGNAAGTYHFPQMELIESGEIGDEDRLEFIDNVANYYYLHDDVTIILLSCGGAVLVAALVFLGLAFHFVKQAGGLESLKRHQGKISPVEMDAYSPSETGKTDAATSQQTELDDHYITECKMRKEPLDEFTIRRFREDQQEALRRLEASIPVPETFLERKFRRAILDGQETRRRKAFPKGYKQASAAETKARHKREDAEEAERRDLNVLGEERPLDLAARRKIQDFQDQSHRRSLIAKGAS